MQRKEGFVDVDKMLEEIGINITNINTIISNPKISLIINMDFPIEKLIFSFLYNGKKYFYKYNNTSDPYNELIASYLLEEFNIPHVEYDLAILKDKSGVISEDFKKENVVYTTISEILNNYYKYPNNVEDYNNLECIWDSLEYRYKDNPNKREIIKKLMKRIIDIYIFDIITCQCDRHSLDLGIIENDRIIDIQPIFDNEKILFINNSYSNIRLSVNEMKFSLLVDDLKKFMNISSDEYTDIIKEKIWIISEENLKIVFDRIENKTGYPIPKTKKVYYLEEYEKHRKRLEQVLENSKTIRKR